MVTYQFRIDEETWTEWKRTVPREKSLETRVIELVEADRDGRVRPPEPTVEDAAEALPEKTGVPLQAREFVGTIDAAPGVVREELREMPRVWPNTLASIQFEVVDGQRVHEVGSYALRPEGFLGMWQFHVRLTPTQDGRTRLWAHYERNAWRHPVRHYRAEGWDADRGVREVASWFASDELFEPSERAAALIGSE